MDTVLVVDDDDVVLRLMSRAIAYAGIRPVATTSPGEALDHLQQQHFDVLLTDLVMDGIDGVELFLQARAQHPLLRGICFSGHLGQEEVRRITAAGFDDCLVKPVRKDDLVPAIQRSLALRQHWRQRIAAVENREDG
jgi:CheY-like chemotaxis protein